jgi:glutamate/tyrosine decarboxylase-like PLP-dependent enzyme
VALLAARKEVIRRVQAQFPYLSPAEINGRLVAYCSDQAHSSVEKACLIGLVKLNLVPSDDKLRLRGNALRQAIAKDKENGLIPFYVSEIIIGFSFELEVFSFVQHWVQLERVLLIILLNWVRYVSLN